MAVEDEIKRNLEQEKKIIKEILYLQSGMQSLSDSERIFYQETIKSLKVQIKILNDSLLPLIKGISFAKPLSESQVSVVSKPLKIFNKPVEVSKPKVVEIPIKSVVKVVEPIKMKYVSPSTKENVFVTIDKKEKERFAKELRLSENNLDRLKAVSKKKQESGRKWENLAKISNKVYGKAGEALSPAFSDLKKDLRGANILFLLPTYVAMAMFITTISLLFSIVLFVLGLIFFPDKATLFVGWTFFIPIGIFLFFYFYPSLQKGNVEKNISAELPFATIYMSAIAGSNVEPIRIFKILNSTPEYPYIGTELKKIINQVELYGLDLVNSLKNTALTATNRKFAELLGGMATNILSGGSLKNYLDKKAENYLADYKLEMEKYSAIAGTFMDIYISVLITAPLILMMVFVVVQLTGMGSFSSVMIFVLSIGGVVVANLIFLFVLHIKQPK